MQAVPSKKKTIPKHILVVDDDETFRGVLVQTLLKEGYQVTQADHGKTAQDVIGVETIDAVISDINMPGISGIQLMNYSRKVKPEVPVILMTGFAELKETKEAYELGARGFLPKPFKKEDLLGILNECLFPTTNEAPEEVNQDLEFCKLNIEDFISGREIKFDIYVRLSETKYVKIANQGENIPIERINSYKAKNIRHLCMQKDDFKKYMGFNLSLLPLVNAKSTISKEKKRAFLKHTSDVILEHLHLNGVDEEGFQGAKTIVESTSMLLTEPDDMMSLLTMLNTHGDHLYAHGLGVSMYSVMIAKEVKWHSPANQYKVAMGGLLHDIGKKEIAKEILLKHRKDMSAEEIQLYETHPQRGMDILSKVPSVPSDVLQIVFQHHENCLGIGFPMRLTKQHIHPMARLVSVANEFCTLVLKGPESLNLSPVEAIQRMNTLLAGKFDTQFLSALMHIFKIPSPHD